MKDPLESPGGNVEVRFSSARKAFRKGQRVKVRVEITGLPRLAKPLALRIQNRSPRIVSLRGGNLKRITILPGHVGRDGRVVRQIEFVTRAAGPFAIASWIGRMFLAHFETLSKEWGDHSESKTTSWYGDGHSLKDSREWVEGTHDYAESKKWHGHGHLVDRTKANNDKHHKFEDSRKWRGHSHEIANTQKQEKDGHSFDKSEEKEWLPHNVALSKNWKGKDHDEKESRKWWGDDHGYSWTMKEDFDEHKKYNHNYDVTRDWEGDNHLYLHTRRWKETDPEHKYDKSKADSGAERERWERDSHDEWTSDIWWDFDHYFESSVKQHDEWRRKGHSEFTSEDWRRDGHALDASRKRDAEKKGR
jgi:hypothetical protein